MLRRLYPYWRPTLGDTVTGGVLLAIAAAIELLHPWPIKWTVDYIIDSQKAPDWLATIWPAFGEQHTGRMILGVALAIVIFAGGDNQLAIVDVQSGGIDERIEIDGLGAIQNPAWSPDGQSIVFTGLQGGISDLYMYDVSTGSVRQLTNDKHAEVHATWSPDGQEIAFLRETRVPGKQRMSEVRMVPALGGSERLLGTVAATREVGPPYEPGLSWSPDGLYVATADKESPEEREGIFLILTKTGEKRRLTTPPQDTLLRDSQPVFSRDGRRVAFIRGMGLRGYQLLVQSMEDPRYECWKTFLPAAG